MALEGLRVREVSTDEGNRLLRIVRRSSGSVVTWRRAQMILLSVQGMDVASIAKVTFTSPDRVREVINNFNADGFDALYPRYAGGRPRVFTLPERREIKKIALTRPVDHGLAFSTWSLGQAGRVPGGQGGGLRHQPRGPPGPALRGGGVLSSDQDLQGLYRSGLRGQEEPGARAL